MPSPGDPSLPPEFDDLNVGITLHDPQTGAILDVNDRLEELYGYSAEELRAMDVADYSVDDPAYTRRLARERMRAAAEGDPQQFEWRVERADGELLWVRVRLSPITLGGRDCVIAEIRDVTEYKGRERRLHLLNRVIRHNLRNEATVLLGQVDRIRSIDGPPALREPLGEIEQVAAEIGRLRDSVEQIEEIVDPEATERRPTNVADAARECVADAEERYPHASISLEIEDEEAWIDGDVGLTYALDHAVENAVEHSDRDHPDVTVRVRRAVGSDRVVLTVCDDGPPIPDIEIEALETQTTTSTRHGAGLGLWVMNWCVDALGGDLTFEIDDTRGNEVRMSLPASTDAGGGHETDRSG